MNSVLFALTKRLMPPVPCFKPCSMNSASASVLARSVRSSASTIVYAGYRLLGVFLSYFSVNI